jgi:hypothetical protein
MRTWLLVAVAACGPSSAELKTAKTTTYNASIDDMIEVAKQAVSQDYKVGGVNQGDCGDPDGQCTAEVITQERWYGAEGDLESPGAGDMTLVRNGSVMSQFIVTLHRTGAHSVVVEVIPKTFQYIGTPKPRELAPDDPGLPPFIHGRADNLSFEVYKLGQKFRTAQ